MSFNQEGHGRDAWRHISPEQLDAATRVMQHWFARITPAALAPPADIDDAVRGPNRADEAGGY